MKIIYSFLSFFVLFLITNNTIAFKGSKCWKGVIVGPPREVYEALGGEDHRDGALIKTFGVTTGSSSSTSSFVTSTGSCSAIGKLDQEKMIYLALNQREVQLDSSLGNGQSLDVLAYFYGLKNCVPSFKKVIKNNYQEIFRENDNPEVIDSSIQHILEKENH